MKKLQRLGLITGIIALAVILTVATVAFLNKEKELPEKEDASEESIEISEEKEEIEITPSGIAELLWQEESHTNGETLVLKTEGGDIVIELYPDEAGEKAKESAPLLTEQPVEEYNGFIKIPSGGKEFTLKESEHAFVYGAVAFITEEERAFSEIFIVTEKTLSAQSKSYMERNGFSAEKKAIYESLGGIPELEGGGRVFGKVISGFEILNSPETTKIISAEIH